MNKIISIIFGFCITIALVVGLLNYSLFLELKEHTSEEITLLKTNDEALAAKTHILGQQQQKLLNEEYDFLIFIRQNMTTPKHYVVKSGTTGEEVLIATRLSEVFHSTSDRGKTVIMQRGIYDLDSDVELDSKSNMILDGQGSILNLNGYRITFTSNNFTQNSNNQIRNFVMKNGTFSLENSFRATIESMIFENCKSAIEISNTQMWSEATKLENVYWENCQTALTFKTPTGNATSSYENTALDRCYINLYHNNSIGIIVEKSAEVSNSQWTNMRIWMHTNKTHNQTGLHLEGAMADTLLSDVVFECFGNGIQAHIYGIYLGKDSTTGFSLGEGTSFLGNFEARIKNNEGKWIYGVTSVFTEEKQLNFSEPWIVHRYPLTIGSFDAFIKIENLSDNEKVNVTISLNFIDHTNKSITLPPFTNNTIYWLDKKDLYELYPAQNIIWNIVTTADTNLLELQTVAKVTIGVRGTAR